MIYIDRDDLSNSSSPRRREANSGVRLGPETSHTEDEQSETEITTVVCHIHPYILVSICIACVIALITIVIRSKLDNTKNVYNNNNSVGVKYNNHTKISRFHVTPFGIFNAESNVAF